MTFCRLLLLYSLAAPPSSLTTAETAREDLLPPLAIVAGFPSAKAAQANLEAACLHYAYVQSYAPLEHYLPGRNFEDDLHAACLWRWTWEQVVYCRQMVGIEADQRRALARLVARHGWRAVLTGEFPPPGMLVGR